MKAREEVTKNLGARSVIILHTLAYDQTGRSYKVCYSTYKGHLYLEVSDGWVYMWATFKYRTGYLKELSEEVRPCARGKGLRDSVLESLKNKFPRIRTLPVKETPPA